MRITNREIEWYDDFSRAIEEDYYSDERSDMYEDTELGRIFSAEFRHLNYREEEE